MGNKILALQERVSELTINQKGLFTILSVDTFDNSCVVLGTSEKEKDAMDLADSAATDARQDNDSEDEDFGFLGTRYYVYNPSGEYVYTGRIKKGSLN